MNKPKKLKVILAERGIRARALAAAIGITPQYLCNIMNPRRPALALEKKAKIANYLKLRISDIDFQGA